MALTDYGLTPQGFIKMRLPEIRQEIVADLRARATASGDTVVPDTRPDSILGLTIDTFAEREAALWDLAEAIYLSKYPYSAFGVSLDRSVSFTGVERLKPEPSRVPVIFYGPEGSAVDVGFQVRNASTQTIYVTTESFTISALRAADVLISPVVESNALYRVTVDGVDYDYTSDEAPTPATIAAGVAGALGNAGMTVETSGGQVRAYDVSTEGRSILLSPNMTFAEIGTPHVVETPEPMSEAAEPGQISETVSLPSFALRVDNRAPGVEGRTRESDAELQQRYSEGVFVLGAATLPSLAPNVRRVPGVLDVVTRKNDTDFETPAGLLPHSTHFIVDGGIDAEVAREIYRVIAAGILTNGAVSVALDTEEGPQTIRFDRPAPVYVWVRVFVTPKSDASAFPPDGLGRIRDGVVSQGSALHSGEAVVWQAFFTPVYAVEGVESAELKFAYSSDPNFTPGPDDWEAANIAVTPVQRVRFDPSRVEVTLNA